MALGKINIFNGNWVDMVFTGRNQNYGAYVLRKKSNEYTTKGIIFAIVFFSLAITMPMIVNLIKGLVPKQEEVKITEVTTLEEPPPIDKNQPPPPPAEPPPPLKSTVKFTPPVIKPDEEVPDEPPPIQEEMKDKDAGTKTVEGDEDGIDASLVESGDGLTGEAAPEIMTFAEQMPEFDGNVQEYLSQNISYPSLARDNGIEGRVVLQFVVGKDGKIDDNSITVVKKVGWGLEEEAIRVVKSMPRWKPGKQNGNPVVVRCTLPITFKLDQ